MKIAVCQMDVEWLDTKTNLKKVSDWLQELAPRDLDLIVFPEMCLSGFAMEREQASVSMAGPEVEELLRISRHMKAKILLGAAVNNQGNYSNDCLVLHAGEIMARYSKMNPFTFGGEHEHYSPGREFVVFKHEEVGIMPMICYDLRFPRLFEAVIDQVGLYIVIASWPAGRAEHWKTLLRSRAIDYQAFVIGVNRTGSGGGLEYTGDSAAFDPLGEQVLGFMRGEGIELIEIDVNRVVKWRESFPILKDRKALAQKLETVDAK